MEWISCEKRMPKEGETVIAFWTSLDGEIRPGCFGVATYWPEHWHNPEDDEDDYCDPTHWMPLPEAPNDRVEGRDAASSRRVPSHDGLEG